MFGSLILPIKPGGVSWPAGSCRRETLELIMQQTQATHHANTRSDAWHVDMLTCLTVCGEWRVWYCLTWYDMSCVLHILVSQHGVTRERRISSQFYNTNISANFDHGILNSEVYYESKCGFHLQIVSITPGSELSPLWAEEGLTVSCYVSELQRSRPRPIITSDGRQRLQPVPAEILILDKRREELMVRSWCLGYSPLGTSATVLGSRLQQVRKMWTWETIGNLFKI